MVDQFNSFPDNPAEPAADTTVEPRATADQWAGMTFAALDIDISKFGPRWDFARGAVARVAVSLLRFDDQELTRHFLAEAEPLRRAMDAHAGLQEEIDYLKTHIEALEMASARMLCVASRCAKTPP